MGCLLKSTAMTTKVIMRKKRKDKSGTPRDHKCQPEKWIFPRPEDLIECIVVQD